MSVCFKNKNQLQVRANTVCWFFICLFSVLFSRAVFVFHKGRGVNIIPRTNRFFFSRYFWISDSTRVLRVDTFSGRIRFVTESFLTHTINNVNSMFDVNYFFSPRDYQLLAPSRHCSPLCQMLSFRIKIHRFRDSTCVLPASFNRVQRVHFLPFIGFWFRQAWPAHYSFLLCIKSNTFSLYKNPRIFFLNFFLRDFLIFYRSEKFP